MKLMSALNGLLQNLTVCFTPPGGSGDLLTAGAFYESVIVPAVKSPDFRKKLLENPEAILAQIGMELPEGVRVRFVEDTSDTIHIVIPPYIGD